MSGTRNRTNKIGRKTKRTSQHPIDSAPVQLERLIFMLQLQQRMEMKLLQLVLPATVSTIIPRASSAVAPPQVLASALAATTIAATTIISPRVSELSAAAAEINGNKI